MHSQMLPLSERSKKYLLALTLALLAVVSAPLLPDEYVPRSCLLTRMQGELERWEIEEGRIVLRFKEPTGGAIAEWRSSGISDEMIASNLISIPDYGCDPVTGDIVDSIPTILRWDRSSLPSEYWASSFREAWTYPTYDPKTKSTNTSFEMKPKPIIRRKPLYRKYESTADDAPIGYLRVSSRLASELLGFTVRGNSPDDTTALFWEEVFRSSRPVVLTEGAKKAASLLSHGFIAVSIPGACRALDVSRARDEGVISLKADLAPLLRTPRKVFIAFDNDSSQYVRKLVATALLSTAELLRDKGSDVRVITIEGKEKGIDEFISSRGKTALDALIAQSKPLAEWRKGVSEQIELRKLLQSPICAPPQN